MRIFLTFAVVTVLPGGLFGAEPQPPANAPSCCIPGASKMSVIPALSTTAAYDTAVYHLAHVKAHDAIPTVRDAVFKSLTAQAAGKTIAPHSFSLVLIPTTSDDALVAICPREHAAAVKDAVAACDVVRQYAVKVQVFEITKNGETIPAGAPALIVGRGGNMQCCTSGDETVTLTLKVGKLHHPAAGEVVLPNPPESGDCEPSEAAEDEAAGACHGQCSQGLGTPSCSSCQSAKCHSCIEKACNGEMFEEEGEATLSQTGAKAQAADSELGTGTPTACPARQRTSDGATKEYLGFQCEGIETSRPTTSIPILSKIPGLERMFSIHRWTPNPEAPGCDACETRACHAAGETYRNPSIEDHTARDGAGCVRIQSQINGNAWVETPGAVELGFCTPLNPAIEQGQEPPALLSLSPQKEPSQTAVEITAPPQWQSELWKSYRGCSLSDIFEPHPGRESVGRTLGRLVAEIPKHGSGENPEHQPARGLIVVDLPDRVRIFEDATPSAVEKPSPAACPNCREEFGVFLEELFQGTAGAPGDLTPVGHRVAESAGSGGPLDLPNVTHSKIETVTVTYPLHDLVLLDDTGRPVFDTCTIIDHIQSAVAPETWSHPRVSIQLDQHNVSLVIRQTPEVHAKVEAHLQYLRRLQIKQICSAIERLSGAAAAASVLRTGQALQAPAQAAPLPVKQ